jgi:hypothetical protein
MTPTDLYTPLYAAAALIVDRVTHGTPITLDDYAALAKAVRAIDDEQFSDWWERTQAEKAQRTTGGQA